MDTSATTRIYRSVENQAVAGVAAGLAEHFNVPAVWVRAGFVFTSLFWGLGLVLYAALWIILPEARTEENQEPQALASDQPLRVAGIVLLCLGILLLLWRFLSWLSFAWVLPLLLISAGIFLLNRRTT